MNHQMEATSDEDGSQIMCGICHAEPPINGVQLKCGHVFCYLCIKSASEISCCCALCRAEIGIEFNFQEHELLGTIKVPTSNDGYFWFYEGFQGWWLFDPDTNKEIEQVHQRGATSLEKFIAGGPYIIDLRNMIQKRQDDPQGRARRICRATLDMENILGMAGIKGCDFRQVLKMMRNEATQNSASIQPSSLPPISRPRTSLRSPE